MARGGAAHGRRPPPPRHDNGGARHLALRGRTADDLLDRLVLAAGAELSVPDTAASACPLARLTCAASRVRRGRSAADAAAAEEAVPTELVAEPFLLRQLARAYLAAPWALPGGMVRGRTPREQPPGGWPFPVGLDAAEEGEPRHAGALNLSESASAVLAQRGLRGPSTRLGLGKVYS